MIYPLCLICGRPRVCASSPVSAIRAICGCPGYIPAEDRGYPDAEDEVRRLFDLVASQQAEIARLQTGHDLYEVVRRMSVSQFYGACTRHYIEGIPLDDILEGRAHEFGLTVRRAP